MDLQGIGAISAATVAAIGVPATLLVGRWQFRAAMKAAAQTAEAGIAQSESNYRAALDAVRAEGLNAHDQWRRGIQRQAYAEFLLASHQVAEAVERLKEDGEKYGDTENTSELRAVLANARSKLAATRLVIVLEGPDTVADAAGALADSTLNIARGVAWEASMWHAVHSLKRLADDTLSSADGQSAVRAALDAVEGVLHPHRASWYWEMRNEEVLSEATQAIGGISDLVSEEHLRGLYELVINGLASLMPRHREVVERSQVAMGNFVDAARTELHHPLSSA
ncbi:hypothetical protein [Streptomyces sp. NBC_00893]|uniref:hypothetical protein n=1 Tax=Streptomyces sp. NBC_00893 TaxID=2975862 RepID=UPI00225B77FB|nr:hypothetical protein [Streptomyces sp. NBC_00893]MCX4851757.1 hypothetical protein [Streptomyces sp. NBC_00893]